MMLLKCCYFEDMLGVSWSPVRECHAFQSLRIIRVQCNSRKTRCRPQIPKYIDVRHHFFRKLIRQGGISVNHVPSQYQQANILTKAIAFDVFMITPTFLNGFRCLVHFAFGVVDRCLDVCILISICFVCARAYEQWHSWGAVLVS